MAEQIENGGSGVKVGLHVDENEQGHVFAITENEQQQAAEKGNEFNINSGEIAFSTNSTARTSILYFKNDEDTPYIITAVAVGLGTRSVTITDAANVFIVRNPTAGTTITNGSAVDMKSNSNFGSTNTLKATTLAYKGADGDGVTTGGTDHALIYMTDGRLYANLNIELPRGASVAIEFDGNTSGAFNVYAALIGYIKDPKNS